MGLDKRSGDLVLLAIQFVSVAASLSVLPFMSVYVERLSPGGQTALWAAVAAAAPAAVAIIATPVWTVVINKIGSRSTLFISCLIIGVSLYGQAIASSAMSFALARGLQGSAGIGVIILVAASNGKTSERIFLRLQQALAFGCIIGPLLGGLAFEHDAVKAVLISQAFFICALGGLAFRLYPVDMPKENIDGATSPSIQNSRPETVIVVAAACVAAGSFGFIPFFADWAMSRFAGLSVGWLGTLHSAGWAVAIVSLPFWQRFIRAQKEVLAMQYAALGAFASLFLVLVAPTLVILALFRFAHSAFQAAVSPLLFSLLGRSPARSSSLSMGRTATTVGQIAGPGICGLAVFAGGADAALISALSLTLFGAGLLCGLSRRRFDHDR